LNAVERKLKIRERLASYEFPSSVTLSRSLQVSESTIRRDLMELEGAGALRLDHGGAISLQTRDEMLDFVRLSGIARGEKVRIGKTAASLVANGQTVILGPGSTVVEVARNLIGRPIQVITNSISVRQIFWDSISVEVTMTGGHLFPRIGVQLGPVAENMLSGVSADLLILGVAGVSEEGLSDSNTLLVGAVHNMLEVASRVVVVADDTKFGRKSKVQVAPLDAVHQIVADDGPPREYLDMQKSHGVACLLA
jgi:DeoR family fructose operon transcriptional repressor